ncbi:MAG: response regulator [Planctomycetota bacterium]|nr:response regulator [Planctomycetota bacterium]
MAKRVLIIDDESEIRRNLTFGLTQEGFSCTACPDGISAIHELHRSREKDEGYDYLVTDIFMPDIDGLKILKVIKNEFPDLPVLVITGFGDELLKETALAEHNTGYLDKPFEISDLVEALEELSPGTTTSEPTRAEDDEPVEIRESVSAYLTLRTTGEKDPMEVFKKLYFLEGVSSMDAVRGDMDMVLLVQADSEEKIEELVNQIKAVDGIEIASMSPVERPKLDRDIEEFIDIYKKSVKEGAQKHSSKLRGTTSYIIVDVDKEALQEIFTTVFFLDEVIFCDVVDEGNKLVGMINDVEPMGKTPRIIERLKQIDGVLRVKEAKIIKLIDA